MTKRTVRLTDGRSGELVTETITPAKALRWVRTSRGRLNHTKVQGYSHLMRSGRWRDGGRITIVGRSVVTGRHLLAAIANTGNTLRVDVLRIPR